MFIWVTAIFLQAYHVTFSEAFTSQLPRSLYFAYPAKISQTSITMKTSGGIFSEDDNIFDIEAARRHFESLVSSGSGFTEEATEIDERDDKFSSPVLLSVASESSLPLPEAPPLDVKVPPRPPLTSIERERRSAEIELLGLLTEGDKEVVSEIYNLWFSQRGATPAKILREADQLMEEGLDGQRKAEVMLRSLIEEYGVYFTEPVNRLATLYYVQGRLEEALTLNKIVLSIKPWHIGALSHIVMVYAAMGDPVSARQWAALRLPSFSNNGSNRKRTRWVERAVVEATILLHKGEKMNVASFGISDKEWIGRHRTTENPNDSWQ